MSTRDNFALRHSVVDKYKRFAALANSRLAEFGTFFGNRSLPQAPAAKTTVLAIGILA